MRRLKMILLLAFSIGFIPYASAYAHEKLNVFVSILPQKFFLTLVELAGHLDPHLHHLVALHPLGYTGAPAPGDQRPC